MERTSDCSRLEPVHKARIRRAALDEAVEGFDERSDARQPLRKAARAHDDDSVMLTARGAVLPVEHEKVIAVVGDERAPVLDGSLEQLGVRQAPQLALLGDGNGVPPSST